MMMPCPDCHASVPVAWRDGRAYVAPHGCAADDRAAMLPRQLAMWVAFPFGRDGAGRPLCRYCGDVVVSPRRSWCSDACVEAAKIACGWSAVIRDAVFRRDRGVCAVSGVDTEALGIQLRRVQEGWRRVRRWVGDPVVMGGLERRGYRRDRTLWEADHVVPVAEGGGGCGLQGYRTLCRPCHVRVTAELRARLATKAGRARSRELGEPELGQPQQIGLPLANGGP